MNKAGAYFFDIDGTLLVTRDLVHWNGLHQAMLEVYAVDTTIEGLPNHGKTDVAILRAALKRCGVSDLTFENRLPDALAVVCREVAKNFQYFSIDVCSGIPEVLSHIQECGKLLGVASGNLETVGWSKVSAARLRTFFSVGSFGDRCEYRSAIFQNAVDLAKNCLGSTASVCFIGDTPDDILAARHVNAKIVSVSSGTFAFQELASLAPDACYPSCCEFLAELETAPPK